MATIDLGIPEEVRIIVKAISNPWWRNAKEIRETKVPASGIKFSIYKIKKI